MPIGLQTNVSTNLKEEHNRVYTNKDGTFEKGSHTVTISVSVVIASAVLVLCALLCYREVMRRKKLSEINEEKARRESIRQSVRLKLQEMENLSDAAPFSEQSGSKVPLVTFGDVITISPAHSPILQERKLPTAHSRHQNEYFMLYHPRYNFGGKRRINHIPSRQSNGQLSYRQQQQIRNLHRKLKGNVNQESGHQRVQNSHNNFYYRLQVSSLKQKDKEWKPCTSLVQQGSAQ